jgi:2',3'-cyclic-nucleotide 2'-phosphodiesterase (5'-nucleotidase family)
MQYIFRWILVLLISGTVSCSTSRRAVSAGKDDGMLEVIFVQVNDVYEIAPTSGGKAGGMARVATVKKEYKKQNANTFLVMAGDFVSPSIFNGLTYQGKRIRGKQMIEAMNAAGIDLAIFGNHEFDITETELQERINESSFQWIASNSFHKKNGTIKPFEKFSGNNVSVFPQTLILPLTDSDGTVVKIGFIGLTLPFNKADYVDYSDPLVTAEKSYNQIKDSCDAVIAITHQFIDDDIMLAERLPNLALVLGGHEHDMRFEKTGNVFITKAHANAKSAFIIKLIIDKNKKTHEAAPTLKMLDQTVMLDSNTDAAVKKWSEIANQNYTSPGFDARKVVIAGGDSLDGRETEIRSGSTNLTSLIPVAMAEACPESVVSIMNAGSIRVDDILYPPITQYDILRALPFGGAIREAEIKGSLLLQVLDAGEKNRGTGGYLHYHPIQYLPSQSDPTRGEWMLKGTSIDTGKVYRVAFSDFLVTGKEANLGFLNKDNPAMIKLYDSETSPESLKSDIRLAIIRYLEKLKSNP